MHIIHNIK